jgi:CRISP-associated protein Cas1
MLSFTYTLLLAEAVSACELAGLDPHLGVLHTPRDDRPSALDLVRTRQVTPADFTNTEATTGQLDDSARRRFLAAYEKRMLTLVHHADENRRIPWRQLLYALRRGVSPPCLRTRSRSTSRWDGDERPSALRRGVWHLRR